jgi:hypothetical protein
VIPAVIAREYTCEFIAVPATLCRGPAVWSATDHKGICSGYNIPWSSTISETMGTIYQLRNAEFQPQTFLFCLVIYCPKFFWIPGFVIHP